MLRLDLDGPLRLLERHSLDGRQWEVCVIAAGFSLNHEGAHPRYYPAEVLSAAADKFNGRPVCVYQFGGAHDHRTPAMVDERPQGAAGNVVGFLRECHWCDQSRELHATLVVHHQPTRELLLAAYHNGGGLGFSIDAMGSGRLHMAEGRKAWVVDALASVDSLDVVTHPAAGGRLLRLVASRRMTVNTWQRLLASIVSRRPAWMTGFDAEGHDEPGARDQVMMVLGAAKSRALGRLGESRRGTQRYAEAAVESAELEQVLAMLQAGDAEGAMAALEQLLAAAVEPAPADPSSAPPAPMMESAMAREIVRDRVESVLSAASLPAPLAQRVRESFAGSVTATRSVIEARVAAERELLAQLSPAITTSVGVREAVSVGPDQAQKYAWAMDGWFNKRFTLGDDGERYMFASLHEAYRVITGSHMSQGAVGKKLMRAVAHCQPSGPLTGSEGWRSGGQVEAMREFRESAAQNLRRLGEANITSTFAEILGDSVTRRLQKAYSLGDLDPWRKIYTVESWSDFRTRRYGRLAYLGDLSTVAENAVYAEHADLTDEEATVAPTKKGNLIYFSMESFVNDDLDAFRDLPQRVGIAGARTLSKALLDTGILANPTMTYDSTSLIHVDHANSGVTALSLTTLETAALQMMKQTEYGSSERLGGRNRPKYLLVPPDLEPTAWELVSSAVKVTAADTWLPNRVREVLGLEVLVSHYTADTNNWMLVADPTMMESAVVGFVDGQEEPAIFVADQENQGAMFTADRIGMKWRFIFGSTIIDHRAFAGGIVA